MLLCEPTKLNIKMIKIDVNGRYIPLYNGVLHLAVAHLNEGKSDVRSYGRNVLELSRNNHGETRTDSYGSRHVEHILPLLQLTQAVRGFGMENIPTPAVFLDRMVYQVHLQQLKGEVKTKAAMLYLGHYELHNPGAAALAAMDLDLERVCEVFALHIEDNRVSITEWLTMIPLKKKVYA